MAIKKEIDGVSQDGKKSILPSKEGVEEAMGVDMESLSFETALERLEACAEKLTESGVSLENAIKAYEAGLQYHAVCDRILKAAEQKIETIGAAENGGGENDA